MKYWTRQALQNELEDLAEHSQRVSNEFSMGHPDLAVCERLLKRIRQQSKEILLKKVKYGWPE